MANLTLSIDDKLLKEARIIALERDTSLNQLIRDFLQELSETENNKQEAKQRLLSTRFDYDPTPMKREDIYER